MTDNRSPKQAGGKWAGLFDNRTGNRDNRTPEQIEAWRRLTTSIAGAPADSRTPEQVDAANREYELSRDARVHPPRVFAPAAPTGDAALICPHCGQAGGVHSHAGKIKAGVSGGKATAALLTGGLSLLLPGVGLSRKVAVTARRCTNCGSQWTVA